MADDLAAFNPFSTPVSYNDGFDVRPQRDIFVSESSIDSLVHPRGTSTASVTSFPTPAATSPIKQPAGHRAGASSSSSPLFQPRPPVVTAAAPLFPTTTPPTPLSFAQVAPPQPRTSVPITIDGFFQHPVSQTFVPSEASASSKPLSRMLLQLNKLHKGGVITAEQKGQLKDRVLGGRITEAELQQQYGPAMVRSQPPSISSFQFAQASSPATTLPVFGSLQPKAPQFAFTQASPASSSVPATWKTVEGTLLVLDSPSIAPASKVACFDMDDTLITPKSGRAFATGRDDWQWWHPSVPDRLKHLHAQGYKIVIFTNQKGISTGKTQAKDIQGKIQDISSALNIPIQAFVATDDDKWRKPSVSMWNYFVKHHNGGLPVDLRQSFYCGDAAGRGAAWDGNAKTKKDHSCSDRKFAHNVGILFQIPEACFLGQPDVKFEWDSINPTTVPKQVVPYEGQLVSQTQEMILCVGFPASGKSTFTKRYLVPKGYVHVNQDTLKSKSACLNAARTAIAQGKSVVIDNTNPSAAVRAEYIAIAAEHGVPVRCFLFKTPIELAEHLNLYREIVDGVKHIPPIGYVMFKKNYQEPASSEGFIEIKKINFVPQFDDAEREKLFYHFT